MAIDEEIALLAQLGELQAKRAGGNIQVSIAGAVVKNTDLMAAFEEASNDPRNLITSLIPIGQLELRPEVAAGFADREVPAARTADTFSNAIRDLFALVTAPASIVEHDQMVYMWGQHKMRNIKQYDSEKKAWRDLPQGNAVAIRR